jgi:hypothetical protein
MPSDFIGPYLVPKGGQVDPVRQKTWPGDGEALFGKRGSHVEKPAACMPGNILQFLIDFFCLQRETGQGHGHDGVEGDAGIRTE